MVVKRPNPSIVQDIKAHPVATIGVVAGVGVLLYLLYESQNQQAQSVGTPSDSFWQGYSTAQEDFLGGKLFGGEYASGSPPTTGSTQTPGSTASDTSGAQGVTPTTNVIFVPAYTTDITSAGHQTTGAPQVPRFAGTHVPSHLKPPKPHKPPKHKPVPYIPPPAQTPLGTTRLGKVPVRGPS